MSEASQPAAAGRLEYEEVKEYSFLEELLVSRRVNLSYIIMLVCCSISIALALFHLFIALYGTPEGRSFRSVHLSVMLVLAILINPLFRSSHKDQILQPGDPRNLLRAAGFGIDMILVGLVIAVQIWTLWDIDAFQMRLGSKHPTDMMFGGILIAIVLEATRRAVGIAMVCVTGFFIVHTLYSHYFFGIFYGPPTRFAKYIDVMFVSSNGIFGIPLHVAATYIVLFIVFGGVLIRSGAGRFFIDLAVALTGHRIGGPAKAATLSSAFMGTVSGSAVANVVTTGSFTIPLMKKTGYRAKFAAAVEACASSGGQITPPIMGAAAFIIAENLQVSYFAVIIAAAIPAFLYFVTVYFMVHLEAEKHGIESIPAERLPQVMEVLKGGWHLLLSLVILIAFLMMGYTPMKSAFWGILSLIALSFFHRGTRMSPVDILAAFETGVRSTVAVTVACACAGIIIGSIFASGFGLKFTQSVIDMSGGNLPLLLSMTAVASILLGMGMTTTAVYITVAALIVPSLEQIGVNVIAAHMFAFYFGVVSTITPPVALAAFAGAAIARTPPMATAFEASKVGIAKYLVPFAFIYNPSLLLEGPVWMTVVSTALVLIGLWVLSLGLEGWCRGRLGPAPRAILLISALFLMVPVSATPFGIPGTVVVVAGLLASGGIYAWRRTIPAGQPAQ
ncbi:TRAP transporter permease [Nisaea sp.]|uniref:TRAP transporter permease n=1 Tax=Nisaea sp. TaxID=2024842 RepID=UPI003B523BCD